MGGCLRGGSVRPLPWPGHRPPGECSREGSEAGPQVQVQPRGSVSKPTFGHSGAAHSLQRQQCWTGLTGHLAILTLTLDCVSAGEGQRDSGTAREQRRGPRGARVPHLLDARGHSVPTAPRRGRPGRPKARKRPHPQASSRRAHGHQGVCDRQGCAATTAARGTTSCLLV